MTLTDLLGARRGDVKWERPLIFFSACLISECIVWHVLRPVLDPTIGSAYVTTEFSPQFWIQSILDWLVLTILIFTTLRLIRYTYVAILITAVICVPLQRLIWLAVTFTDKFVENFFSEGMIEVMIFHVIIFLLFLVALDLSVRLIKLLLPALLVSAVVNAAFGAIFYLCFLYFGVISVAYSGFYWNLPFSLLFSLLLWSGIWLTQRKLPAGVSEKPRVNRGFYLGSALCANLLSIFLLTAVIIFINTGVWHHKDLDVSIILVLFTFLLEVYGAVVFVVLLYKMWKAIQDGYARTSPGKAVVFLFIPFFNFYWAFQVFRGFAVDYNAFVDRHGIKAEPLSTGLFTSYPIWMILSNFLLLPTPIAMIVLVIMISRICDAVNSIPEILPDENSGIKPESGNPQPSLI